MLREILPNDVMYCAWKECRSKFLFKDRGAEIINAPWGNTYFFCEPACRTGWMMDVHNWTTRELG